VGVRLLFINMMGATHPHSQGREAPALGGGGQKFPRNGGRRGERSEPTLLPAFRRGRNPAPGAPSSLFRNLGEEEVSSPPDPYFSVPEGEQNKFQTMGNVFPSIAPTIKIRIPLGILEDEFRRGFGGNLFPKVSPEAKPLLSKPKVGLEGGIRTIRFHPPDCGGANSDNRHVGNNAPPLARARSARARRGVSEVPEE